MSVSLGQGAFYCSNYGNAYGTSGPSICLFNTSSPTTFLFPSDVEVQGFQFVAGAKNGTVNGTVNYDDGTTGTFPIDGSCCVATVQVLAPEGRTISSFSVPADYDLYLFDSLAWAGVRASPWTSSRRATSSGGRKPNRGTAARLRRAFTGSRGWRLAGSGRTPESSTPTIGRSGNTQL